jgi:hypothetical protein
MYKIERIVFGYMLSFEDLMDFDEMIKWYEESKKVLENQKDSFGVLIDMRNLKPLTDDAQRIMVQGKQLYKNAGMNRSAVILSNMLLQLQFRKLAKDSGIYEWERYISSADTPNWEQVAANWITKGEDPDKRKR